MVSKFHRERLMADIILAEAVNKKLVPDVLKMMSEDKDGNEQKLDLDLLMAVLDRVTDILKDIQNDSDFRREMIEKDESED